MKSSNLIYDNYNNDTVSLIQERAEPGNISQITQHHKRIAIVDDEVKIRVLFKNVLLKEGYDVIAFGDNAQAIKYIKNNANDIDLLILDLNMPHVDGRYFCEMMKIKHPQAKVLISSNYGLNIQKFLIFDADEYFDKSDGIRVLKNKVSMLLGNKK